ncbi:hypothetical protein [Vitreimonas sp.]|uniref:hypothetical protein n=1 Tax=Vitreimonas sp. TaxID=3069702 RepID=UPI002ED8166C
MDGQAALLWAQVATAAATAIATIGLVVFTWMLAERTSQPHVVATLEANQWSMIHIDLILANTGNAVAYDVQLVFEPPLASEELERRKRATPLAELALLKPGQSFASFVGEYQSFKGVEYQIKIMWRRAPGRGRVETNEYKFRIDQFADVTQLGEARPDVQIAKEIKKIREEWGRVASGFKKLEVNIHSSQDRDADRRKRDEFYREKREASSASEKTNPDASSED